MPVLFSPQHLQVLHQIHTRLKDLPSPWAVTGSLGMALQGAPLEVHDIDLQTDEAGAYEIERRFSGRMVRPVKFKESERIRSHLGMFELEGLQVEIMGALQKRLEEGNWEEPVRVELYRQWTELEGLRIPVLSLEYEYRAYLTMGRVEKAEMLRSWLERLA